MASPYGYISYANYTHECDMVFFIDYLDHPECNEIFITHVSPEFQNDYHAMKDIVLAKVKTSKHRYKTVESIWLVDGEESKPIYQHFNHPKPEQQFDEELFNV
jgi:hypothetical protein